MILDGWQKIKIHFGIKRNLELISPELKSILCKIAYCKVPGLDVIYRFYFKKFTTLYKRLAKQP